MNRREFTAALGVFGTGVLAGCVSDDGDTAGGNGNGKTDRNGTTDGDGTTDPTDTPTPTEEPEASDGADDGKGTGDEESSGDEAGNGSGDEGPVAVVEAFFEAYRSGDPERLNSFLHPDGPRPVPEDQETNLPEVEFTIESYEVTDRGEDRAVVELTVSEDSAPQIKRLESVKLRRIDEGWKIYKFEQSQESVVPNVAFEIEQENGAITVTHTSGDSVAASQLSIRGEGISEGTWTKLNGESDEDGMVTAGHQVTVSTTDSTVEIRIVWESADGNRSATLASAAMASESVSDADAPKEVRDYLADADAFDGVTDLTGEDEVTVVVGGGENGLAFDPAAVRISPGTTVVWEWSGEGGGHNIVHEDGAFESELAMEEDFTFEHTFEESGNALYYCAPHRALGMKGAIIVE